MRPSIRNVLTWTRQPPDFLGGDWTETDVQDVMTSKSMEIWLGYSDQDWYEKLLESRLRRALDGSFRRDPNNPNA